MINGIKPITPFTSPKESTGDTVSIWTLFSHTGVYIIMAIRSPIPAGLGIFCCYFFWCQPARLVCQSLQPGSMWYTIVDDDVEAAPIYRCNSKAKQPTRPCKNHDLHMKWEPTQTANWQKQQTQSSVVPACRLLESTSKIQGNTEMYIISVVRLRIGPDIATPAWIDQCTLNDSSHFTPLKNNSTCYLWRSMHPSLKGHMHYY